MLRYPTALVPSISQGQGGKLTKEACTPYSCCTDSSFPCCSSASLNQRTSKDRRGASFLGSYERPIWGFSMQHGWLGPRSCSFSNWRLRAWIETFPKTCHNATFYSILGASVACALSAPLQTQKNPQQNNHPPQNKNKNKQENPTKNNKEEKWRSLGLSSLRFLVKISHTLPYN